MIRNLLDAVGKAAEKAGVGVKLAHKKDEDEDDGDGVVGRQCSEATRTRSTPCSPAKRMSLAAPRGSGRDRSSPGAVDVLFVDEAGQMSLANVLAVSQAAESIVLLGDPQQLEQPQKGSHPEGVNASALEHILGEPPDDSGRPRHLPAGHVAAARRASARSRRSCSTRAGSTSKPGLERQRLTGAGEFDGSGLWVVEVDHDGNRNSSIEEVEVVATLVARLHRARRALGRRGRQRPRR